MSLLLEGKRAFITGGTRGIGAAMCEVFAREGADVAFNYNSRDDLAAETSGKIEAHGRKSKAFKVSIIDRFGMKHLTRELVHEWGGIDILVNNAAINRSDASFAHVRPLRNLKSRDDRIYQVPGARGRYFWRQRKCHCRRHLRY